MSLVVALKLNEDSPLLREVFSLVLGQNPPGQNPPGQNPPDKIPLGQNPPGQNPPGQNPPDKIPPLYSIYNIPLPPKF